MAETSALRYLIARQFEPLFRAMDPEHHRLETGHCRHCGGKMNTSYFPRHHTEETFILSLREINDPMGWFDLGKHADDCKYARGVWSLLEIWAVAKDATVMLR